MECPSHRVLGLRIQKVQQWWSPGCQSSQRISILNLGTCLGELFDSLSGVVFMPLHRPSYEVYDFYDI